MGLDFELINRQDTSDLSHASYSRACHCCGVARMEGCLARGSDPFDCCIFDSGSVFREQLSNE